MFRYLSNTLKTILPQKVFIFFRMIYRNSINRKDISSLKAIEINESKLEIFNFNIDQIKSTLAEKQLSYSDPSLSWHYHLFAGLKGLYEKKECPINNILEIGTLDGAFTNFLSSLFENSKIYTMDLERNCQEFKATYDRNREDLLDKFIRKRELNLLAENIKFYEKNSIHMNEIFRKIKFDLIWIDGCHLNPQVTIDIINSLNIITDNGIILVDDVIMNENFRSDGYVSNESYRTLNLLEKNNILKNSFFIKRTRPSNYKDLKYISLSQKNI